MSEVEDVSISLLMDARQEFTRLIKENLYGGGLKSEGRAALIARNALDERLFAMRNNELMKGKATDLIKIKNAIVLERYSELLVILEDYAGRFGKGAKAIKQGMLGIIRDPDVFGQFSAKHQAKIKKVATGFSWLAKRRFEKLHRLIRAEAAKYLP